MTVKLRLMRMGKKKQPTYRVVVADSRSPRDGRFIEAVGTYQPRMDPSGIEIDNGRVLGWLSKGAQPTETVRKLLVVSGAWEQFEAARPVKPAPRQRPGRGAAKSGPAAKSAAKKAPAKKSEAVAEPPAAEIEDEAGDEDAAEAES